MFLKYEYEVGKFSLRKKLNSVQFRNGLGKSFVIEG